MTCNLPKTEICQMIRTQMRMTLTDRLWSIWGLMSDDERLAFTEAFNKAQAPNGSRLSYQKRAQS